METIDVYRKVVYFVDCPECKRNAIEVGAEGDIVWSEGLEFECSNCGEMFALSGMPE